MTELTKSYEDRRAEIEKRSAEFAISYHKIELEHRLELARIDAKCRRIQRLNLALLCLGFASVVVSAIFAP